MDDHKICEIRGIRENPRFRRYPEYKESGVAWIGKIPAHWKVKKIKQVAAFISDKSTPETNAIKISPENVESKTGKVLDFYSTYDSSGVKFQVGDVLFNKIRVYLSKVVFAEYDGYSLGEMIIIRPSLRDVGKYLFYLMLSSRFIEYCHSISRGAKMPRTDVYDILNAQIPITSYQEQAKIATFLDRKTEQIDEFIRIKEHQIELLQEQRTALINQAVTKGLDPNVEMKPSGVEWIGEIPKHWEVSRNKRIFNERDDRSATGEEELLTVSHITGVSPRAKKKNVGMFLAETLEGYKHCSVGNLVINTMWAWMGALGISTFDGIVSPSYNVYQLNSSEYLPRYYDYLYRTPNHVKEIIRWSKGIWSSRWRLYPDAFFSMSAIVPPFGEQKQIVDFLEHKNKQIDELIATELRKIELLQEYRQSLISEAVTGKIDVRNEV